jgi:tetratricopeptide (TPR) repeat protein
LLLPALFLTFCVYFGFAKETFEYHRKRARAFHDSGNYAQVLVETEAARTPLVRIDPVGLPLELWTSRAYKGLGDLEAGLDAIQRARTICPWNVVVWNDMGVLYVMMKRWDDAIPCFQEALRMAPAFDAALNNLAAVYSQKGMFKQSYATFSKSRMRNDASQIKLMYSVCLKLQKYDEAATALREGLARSPDLPDLLENLAYVEYTHLKDLTNAYTHFERLLVLQPNHPKRDEYVRVLNYLAPRVGKKAVEPAKADAAR